MLGPLSRAGTGPGSAAPASSAMGPAAATTTTAPGLPPWRPVRRNGRRTAAPMAACPRLRVKAAAATSSARRRPAAAMEELGGPGPAVLPAQLPARTTGGSARKRPAAAAPSAPAACGSA
eukprot:1861886-Heterocapsa_arctica.AAC.1